jgi:glycosyltransferase involved in cell wall biosynthesis
MHLALVNRWFPPHTGLGGVAMHNYYLARSLVEAGHRVTVLAARWSPDVPAFEVAEGIKVHRLLVRHYPRLHRLPVAGRHMRSFLLARYSARVRRALRALEATDPPDVVEFADVEAEGHDYLRQRRRRQAVVRCHTPMFVLRRYHRPEERPWSTRRVEAREKFCIGRADGLTAPSRDMAQTIARECGVPEGCVAVIPNALDPAPFEEAGRLAAARTPGMDEVAVLHVGRMDRGKGMEVLGRAIPLVVREVPSVRFVLIGEDRPDGQGGTWRARLEALFRDRGVEDRVTFLGPLDQPEMTAWYGRADVAVVPSLIYESFSYTCAQAAAAGLPVVASRIGGIPETIEDGVAGILVDPGDVEQLAAALVRVARDAELRRRMGRAGRDKVRRDFAAAVVAETALGLYRRLAG